MPGELYNHLAEQLMAGIWNEMLTDTSSLQNKNDNENKDENESGECADDDANVRAVGGLTDVRYLVRWLGLRLVPIHSCI